MRRLLRLLLIFGTMAHGHALEQQDVASAAAWRRRRRLQQVQWPGEAQSRQGGIASGLDDSLLQGLELTSRMTETAPVPLGIRTAMFPKCPRVPPPAAAAQVSGAFIDDLGHFLHVLGSAPVPTYPFPYTFFCDAFHPEFYKDIVRAFPPTAVMEPASGASAADQKKNKSYSAAGSNNNANLRWKMSAFDILAMQDTPKWPSLDHAKPVWQRLKHVLFSKQVEALLWKRFNLTRTPTFHDFRIQSDHTGYSIGVHPDSPKKILTLMFYIPLSDTTMYDFGTCLHSEKQFKARDLKRNGEAPCERKFRFASNTGYSFPVSPKSFHSVNSVSKRGGVRQTILVNWYGVTPMTSQPKSFKSSAKSKG